MKVRRLESDLYGLAGSNNKIKALRGLFLSECPRSAFFDDSIILAVLISQPSQSVICEVENQVSGTWLRFP